MFEKERGFLSGLAHGYELLARGHSSGDLWPPLTPAEAITNVETLLGHPHARFLAEEKGFGSIYREVTAGVPARGNLVPDAHLAALLRLHGVKTLYTHDRDYLRFAFLDVRDPLV